MDLNITNKAIDTLCKPNIRWSRDIGKRSGSQEVKNAWDTVEQLPIPVLEDIGACPFVISEVSSGKNAYDEAVQAITFHSFPDMAYTVDDVAMVNPFIAAKKIMEFLKCQPAGIRFYQKISNISGKGREMLELDFAMNFSNRVMDKLDQMEFSDNREMMNMIPNAFDMALQELNSETSN